MKPEVSLIDQAITLIDPRTSREYPPSARADCASGGGELTHFLSLTPASR